MLAVVRSGGGVAVSLLLPAAQQLQLAGHFTLTAIRLEKIDGAANQRFARHTVHAQFGGLWSRQFGTPVIWMRITIEGTVRQALR